MTLSKQHRAALKRSRGSAKAEPDSRWETAREKVAGEGECRACGSRGSLQAAHTIPRSLGGGYSADSVIPLCAGCHSRQHAGGLELAPLLTRGEEIEAVRVAGLTRAYRYLTGE